jgi:hypothetical protein
VQDLERGRPPETVLAEILATEEYWGRSGGDPNAYVRSLFLDIVGREPAQNEYDRWGGQLTADGRVTFQSRLGVASAILAAVPGSWRPKEPIDEPPPQQDYRRGDPLQNYPRRPYYRPLPPSDRPYPPYDRPYPPYDR